MLTTLTVKINEASRQSFDDFLVSLSPFLSNKRFGAAAAALLCALFASFSWCEVSATVGFCQRNALPVRSQTFIFAHLRAAHCYIVIPSCAREAERKRKTGVTFLLSTFAP